MQKGIMLKKSKKNKAYVICFSFASFVNIASFHQHFVLPYFLAVFCSSLPALPPFRVFQGKTHPAPSARPFGAMRCLELWY